jgi:hypothetical protein
MRFTATLSAALLIAGPLASGGTPAARADNNDFMGQAQRFLNNKGDDRDAYQRGRDDEIRRQRAERDRHRRDYDQSSGSNDYYRSPDYGYQNTDR